MASEEVKGFSVTPARVGFILGLIALVTFGWRIAAHTVEQELKLQSHADYISEDKTNTKEILGEIKTLGQKVDRLTFILEANPSLTKRTSLDQIYK